jgi:hypothetical protein
MPKNYNSPKEALFDAGRIEKIGKGRISRENNAWLDEQISAGAFTVTGMGLKASTGPVPAPPTVTRTVKTDTGLYDVREPTRDENAIEAIAGGEKPGMRAVCDNCRNSLTYCPCESPRVMVNGNPSVVSFKSRTTPLPNKRW